VIFNHDGDLMRDFLFHCFPLFMCVSRPAVMASTPKARPVKGRLAVSCVLIGCFRL
jgi:hypothetical protein